MSDDRLADLIEAALLIEGPSGVQSHLYCDEDATQRQMTECYGLAAWAIAEHLTDVIRAAVAADPSIVGMERVSAAADMDARTPESKANPPSYPKVTGRIGFAHMPGVHQQALDKKPDGWAVLRPRRDGDPSQPTVEDALSPDETGFGLPLAQELGRSKPKAAVEPMPSAPAGYVACRSTGGSNVQTTHLVQLDEHGSNGGRPTMCGLTRFATWVKALQPPAGPGFETVPADTPGSTKREPDLPGWSMRNGGVYGPGVAQVKCEACWENARTSDESAESARVVNPHGVPLVPKKVKP